MSAESDAHDALRDAIRAASLAEWDKQIARDGEDVDVRRETRPEVESGILVDYVVVAVYDAGHDDHTVNAILRTDGKCSEYRTLGLLKQAIRDL